MAKCATSRALKWLCCFAWGCATLAASNVFGAGEEKAPLPVRENNSAKGATVVDIGSAWDRVLPLDLTRKPNDVWDRIRRGFAMPDFNSRRVIQLQHSYLRRPAALERMFNRSARYLYYIVDELERRHLPTELALLPMVESSFNPLAYSRSRASGLWQFIPSTGRDYNLTQNRWIDERRDVIASTNAALDYFETIYARHGDWHLALASYNRGENAIGRAVERNRAAGRPAEFSALKLPAETRDYLPKLQAIKNIIAQPELFGIELPYIDNKQFLATVDAPVGIDLATAAEYAGMPLEEFLALNPGFNRPAITNSGQTLIVPSGSAPKFKAIQNEFSQSGKGWRKHTLMQGETLTGVASRYGLTLEQLLQINGLHKRSRPAVGYALLVPARGVDPEGALAVSELLPASARAAARAGVRVEPDRSKKAGRSKAANKRGSAGRTGAKPVAKPAAAKTATKPTAKTYRGKRR
ncbi:MAG: transglycosylase SLT domain-containing protein [Azoarcus sp.]|jgi:membrane-bound lytic murein transglycosylase D|nr:transglycosylase SLT domain-containing protein [Azoarcus sp.]